VDGFPQQFAPNVLVMIDGHSVYNPIDDGVYWEQLPVQIQDIRRIEIIHGPNAALYGSGATRGVINIITEAPKRQMSAEADTRAGNRGALQAYQEVGGSVGSASYRLSHTFQQEGAFPSSAGTGAAGDSMRKNVANLRFNAPLTAATDLDVFAGGNWSDLFPGPGGGGPGGPPAAARVASDQDFERIRLTHRLADDAAVEASASRDDALINQGPSQPSRTIRYDYEILHRFAWDESRLHTTYGASYRKISAYDPTVFSSRLTVETYRGYVNQTAKPTDWLTLQGAYAWEEATDSTMKPSFQTSTIFSSSPRDAVRFSYSVSHTQVDLVPRFSGQGNRGLQPYGVTSYETGYHASRLENRLDADVSLFYDEVGPFKQQSLVRFTDSNSAIARGTTLRLKYRFSAATSVNANYTYERVTDQQGDASVTRNTPSHKANFGAIVVLGRGFTAGANLGYKDAYSITNLGTSANAPAYWRLDTRLAYSPPRWSQVEFYMAAQNLLKPAHVESADGLAVPRTFSGGVSAKF
jgi:outer membrane receptor protein involved in Fe transport